MLNSKAINNLNIGPENLYAATHRGVIANAIRSQALLFGEFNMSKFKRKINIPLCACGCGERVKRSKSKPYNWNKFITGHNAKTEQFRLMFKSKLFQSQEQKEKRSKIQKEIQNKPEVNKKRSESLKKAFKNPETIAKLKANMQRQLKNPAAKKKIRDGIKKAKNTPEAKEWIRNENKRRWADPEYKKRVSRAVKESLNTAEIQTKISKGLRKYHQQIGHYPNKYCDIWNDKAFKKDCKKKCCEICGIKEKKVLAEGVYRTFFKSNLLLHHINFDKADCCPVNLQTLCISCHTKLHHKKIREKRKT
jgi:hypothetical protein